MTGIRPGMRIEIRDVSGAWFPATALSVVEPTHVFKGGRRQKVHDFPVVWVGVDGNPHRSPWPAEDVRVPVEGGLDG